MGIGLPKPGRGVKFILIACGVVFLLQLVMNIAGMPLSGIFGATANGWWQLWRYMTFQFLHSPRDIFHIALNMLGVYMLGTPLERLWGTKRFMVFYLTCGVVAGVAYVVVSFLLLPEDAWSIPLVGASGGVYAILLACAVMFPHMRLILFLFPVPIRLAALIVFGGMVFLILSSFGQDGAAGNPQFWSDVAHLGGALAAAVWIWVLPGMLRAIGEAREQKQQGTWQRKVQQEQDDQEEIDRILNKIQREGIGSLTAREKRKLQDATEKQRKNDRNIRRL